jgi:hypothetical protein
MSGYGMTPNSAIPHNNRRPGEIADIAKEQLKRYERAAETWPVQATMVDGRMGERCRVCHQNLWFHHDTEERPFNYAPAETKALIVAHIRQIHEDIITLDGEIMEDENERQRAVLGATGGGYAVGIGRRDADRPFDQSRDSRGIEYT